MRHFVGYHNPTRMGYSAFTDPNPFSFYTSKTLRDVIGDVVWVVTGQGEGRKTFYLSCWFVIDEIRPSDDAEFGYVVSGKNGGLCDPVPVLNEEQWFSEFLRKMANFSLGFNEIRDPEIIEAFRVLAEDGNCPQSG